MNTGLLFAIISPFLSSISTIFKSAAVKALGPFAVISFGSLLGAFLLIVYLFIKHKKFSLSHLKDNFRDFSLLILTRPIFGELLFVFGLGLTLGVKAILFTKI